jgi:hypothetical protein
MCYYRLSRTTPVHVVNTIVRKHLSNNSAMVRGFCAESCLLLAMMFNLKRKWSIARGGSVLSTVLRAQRRGGIRERFCHYKWNQVRGGKDRHHYKSGTWPIILSETDSSTQRVHLHTRTIYVAVPSQINYCLNTGSLNTFLKKEPTEALRIMNVIYYTHKSKWVSWFLFKKMYVW